ncbi:MAG: phosphatidate cytidylyltransferase [Bacilli bacterium]|nr:phosphatidate cytidylyltransferase [Bacilli bacterium]
MKMRIISATIALLVIIPILISGGMLFDITVFILAILGLKEFLDIKKSKKEVPIFIEFISYIALGLIIFFNSSNNYLLSVDYRLIAGVFLTFLIPTVLYHDRKLYSVNDAFYLIGGVFFLGVSFSLFMLLRSEGLNLLLYLLLIAIFTDTFALFTGLLIGKNKLLSDISPKKTVEGMMGGTVLGVFIASAFYNTVIDSTLPLYIVVFMTTFLSIIGQFGDLVFSAIKRYFSKKDFSNIMPGHGGILDRLDSIIFISLGFMFFISLI